MSSICAEAAVYCGGAPDSGWIGCGFANRAFSTSRCFSRRSDHNCQNPKPSGRIAETITSKTMRLLSPMVRVSRATHAFGAFEALEDGDDLQHFSAQIPPRRRAVCRAKPLRSGFDQVGGGGERRDVQRMR